MAVIVSAVILSSLYTELYCIAEYCWEMTLQILFLDQLWYQPGQDRDFKAKSIFLSFKLHKYIINNNEILLFVSVHHHNKHHKQSRGLTLSLRVMTRLYKQSFI